MTRPLRCDWRHVPVVALLAICVGCTSASPHPGAPNSRSPGSAQDGHRSERTRAGNSQSAPAATVVPHSTGTGASGGGVLLAVNARTGQTRWRTSLPIASVSEPVVGGGLVVVAGTPDCRDPTLTVVALLAATGHLAWRRSIGIPSSCGENPVHLAGDVIIAGGPPGGDLGGYAHPRNKCDRPQQQGAAATGLDLATGNPRWHAPSAAGQVLAVSSDTVLANGTSPGCLVGLDAATGSPRWTVAPAVIPVEISVSGNSAYEQGPLRAGLAVVRADPRTAATSWSVRLPTSDDVAPLAIGDAVVATTAAGSHQRFIALDPKTGHQLWHRSEVASQVWTTAASHVLIVALFHGLDRVQLEALDQSSGSPRWVVSEQGGIGEPATDGTTVVTRTAKHADAFAASTGHRLWTVFGTFTAATVTTDTTYLVTPKTPKNQGQGGGG